LIGSPPGSVHLRLLGALLGSATVASRGLSHAVYSLFKSSGDGDPSLTKNDLRQVRDVNFSWPTEASLEKIPVLPKNIAKNFMQTFLVLR
jgi:hypothetical protein